MRWKFDSSISALYFIIWEIVVLTSCTRRIMRIFLCIIPIPMYILGGFFLYEIFLTHSISLWKIFVYRYFFDERILGYPQRRTWRVSRITMGRHVSRAPIFQFCSRMVVSREMHDPQIRSFLLPTYIFYLKKIFIETRYWKDTRSRSVLGFENEPAIRRGKKY